MTAPTADKNAKTANTKPAAAKSAPEKNAPETNTQQNRIPSHLVNNPILAEFCRRYLEALDEITEYNKAVLAEKDSEWNSTKVLAEARKLAAPENGEPNADIKKAVDDFERLTSEMQKARKNVLDVTSKVLNITLTAVDTRDPEVEGPLKEKRKFAKTIGSQLNTIAEMTNDTTAKEAVNTFLSANPLPAVGRDQASTFTNDGTSTPKYRVTVQVFRDGNEIVNEAGFTKAGFALTKPAVGYERGKAPKAEDLRKAWENAGNTPENTVKNPVEFEDGDRRYVITKK